MNGVVDDLALLEAWRSGDRVAAGELLDRHIEGLARFFRGKVPGDVEDHIQEVFTRCLARGPRLAPGSSFRAYLYAVARNLLCENFRKASRQPFDPMLVSVADVAPNISAVLRRADDQRLLLDALSRIPIDAQLALELYYWEGLRGPELADVLGISEGTARSRIRLAKERIRRILDQLDRRELVRGPADFDAWAASLRDELTKAR